MLEEIRKLLISINDKKELIVKTQKEVEIKISELDKILEKVQTTPMKVDGKK